MQVVLRGDVAGLGKRGDICDVKDGYARNFLFPKGLALAASDGAVAQAARMRRARDLRDAQDRDAARTIASTLVPKVISIAHKAGAEGRLYGSVTVTDVIAAVAAQTGIQLDKRHVSVDAIKTVGSHTATAKLHSDVQFAITLDVVAQ